MDEGHAVDRLLKIAAAFGADVSRPRFTLPLNLDDRRSAQEALKEIRSPRLALDLGGAWLTKRWPPEQFATIARRAFQERSAGLVVVGAAEDEAIVNAFRASLGNIPFVDLHGKTSLPRLAAVFAEVNAVVSNDTGPLHLAAAVGTFVIGIYTCTKPDLTGPYGPNAVAVTTRAHSRLLPDEVRGTDLHERTHTRSGLEGACAEAVSWRRSAFGRERHLSRMKANIND